MVAGHRKPLGSTCSMTWRRDTWKRMPQLGDYLQSEAGTLYRIVGVEENRVRDRHILERVAHFELGYWLYEFYWFSRSRKRAA